MTDADEKLLAAFEARHAGAGVEELTRLGLKELPADLLMRMGAEELARWALDALPKGVVLTDDDQSMIASGLVEILREAVRGEGKNNGSKNLSR
jgi:hypothetical protein